MIGDYEARRLMKVLRETEPNPEVDKRKERFDELNAYVTARHGWLTSVPGDPEVTLEVLTGSPLPEALIDLGYPVEYVGTGERILAGAVVERFTMGADGELEPLTAGSTKPVAETRHHAGICRTERFRFDIGC